MWTAVLRAISIALRRWQTSDCAMFHVSSENLLTASCQSLAFRHLAYRNAAMRGHACNIRHICPGEHQDEAGDHTFTGSHEDEDEGFEAFLSFQLKRVAAFERASKGEGTVPMSIPELPLTLF